MTDANRCTSLTIRTASSTSPDSVVRTITDRRRCRSIPTYCLPAYASIKGLLTLSCATWTLPIITLGDATGAGEGPAPSSHQKGIRVLRPAVINYFRGGSRLNPHPVIGNHRGVYLAFSSRSPATT